VRQFLHLVPLGDQLLGHRQQLAPGGGQLRDPPGAFEEGDAEALLQRRQLRGQGRLGDIQPIRGAADGPASATVWK
jgi:hypothetical protein